MSTTDTPRTDARQLEREVAALRAELCGEALRLRDELKQAMSHNIQAVKSMKLLQAELAAAKHNLTAVENALETACFDRDRAEAELAAAKAEIERLKSNAHVFAHEHLIRAQKAEAELASAREVGAKYEDRYFSMRAELAAAREEATWWVENFGAESTFSGEPQESHENALKWKRKLISELAAAREAKKRLQDELVSICNNDCGCTPVCHCNDNVSALLAWKQEVQESARAAIDAAKKGTS